MTLTDGGRGTRHRRGDDRRSACPTPASASLPEAVDRIFNEFTQASYETAMRFGGTGLGLTITRRLLALYGSSVDVQSTPGQGSTFSFRLRLPLPRR